MCFMIIFSSIFHSSVCIFYYLLIVFFMHALKIIVDKLHCFLTTFLVFLHTLLFFRIIIAHCSLYIPNYSSSLKLNLRYGTAKSNIECFFLLSTNPLPFNCTIQCLDFWIKILMLRFVLLCHSFRCNKINLQRVFHLIIDIY